METKVTYLTVQRLSMLDMELELSILMHNQNYRAGYRINITYLMLSYIVHADGELKLSL